MGGGESSPQSMYIANPGNLSITFDMVWHVIFVHKAFDLFGVRSYRCSYFGKYFGETSTESLDRHRGTKAEKRERRETTGEVVFARLLVGMNIWAGRAVSTCR
jgi:hypothetical protein